MQGSVIVTEPLSRTLRDQTADLHREVEQAIGLPEAITTPELYVACLRRFHQLYRPVGQRLRSFPNWAELGIDIGAHDYAARLASDLARLAPAAPLPPDAPPEACPDLPQFEHALGALYVLEGSSLGGAVILRHLRNAGIEAAADSAFLGAAGNKPGPSWQLLRATLDEYGLHHPRAVPHVIAGAERTFRAVGDWMSLNFWSA